MSEQAYRITDKGRMFLVQNYCAEKNIIEAMQVANGMDSPFAYMLAAMYVVESVTGVSILSAIDASLDNFSEAVDELHKAYNQITLNKLNSLIDDEQDTDIKEQMREMSKFLQTGATIEMDADTTQAEFDATEQEINDLLADIGAGQYLK